MCDIEISKTSLVDPKHKLNIKLDSDIASYAFVAKRLLTKQLAPFIQLTACGEAQVNLLRISSILTEFLPGLYKQSYISFSLCYTCKHKALKRGDKPL